jgi:uroporphyrinogen decarboxylase
MQEKREKGKDLIYKVFNHEPTAVPWVPFAGIHAGALKKYSATEVLVDREKLLEVLLEVNKLYHPDGQPIIFDLQVEAEILGCKLRWADKAPPMVIWHPLAANPTVPDKIPGKHEGRIPIILDVMNAMKKRVGSHTALFGLICGPLTLASHLRGTDFYLDLITNQAFAKDLLDYTTNVALKMIDYYIEAEMDVIAVVDPVVSQISPNTFKKFLSISFHRLFKNIREKNVFSSFFVCGDATKNLKVMCETEPDSIFVDENIDMQTAREILSNFKIILGGNIPLTSIMLFGTQQDNMKYVVDLFDKIGKKDLIIAPGCDMPYDVPPDNVIGVVQAVQEPELIKKSLETYEMGEIEIDIKLPNYHRLHKPLVEVFTIDSDVCAACGYMLETAKEVKEIFGDGIVLIEYKFIQRENIARAKKLQVKHLPCILINGEIKYSSIIPSKDELFNEVKKLI